LLTSHEAIEIGRAQAAIFDVLGYACDPEPSLDGERADANWIKLIWADLSADLQNLRAFKSQADESKAKAVAANSEAARPRQEIKRERMHVEEMDQTSGQLQAEVAAWKDELERVRSEAQHLKSVATATQIELERVRNEYIRCQQALQEIANQKVAAE